MAEVFTGHAGKLVTMEQTISGFKEILAGKYDHLPEVAFYMVGHIDEVRCSLLMLSCHTARNSVHWLPRAISGMAWMLRMC